MTSFNDSKLNFDYNSNIYSNQTYKLSTINLLETFYRLKNIKKRQLEGCSIQGLMEVQKVIKHFSTSSTFSTSSIFQLYTDNATTHHIIFPIK